MKSLGRSCTPAQVRWICCLSLSKSRRVNPLPVGSELLHTFVSCSLRMASQHAWPSAASTRCHAIDGSSLSGVAHYFAIIAHIQNAQLLALNFCAALTCHQSTVVGSAAQKHTKLNSQSAMALAQSATGLAPSFCCVVWCALTASCCC